MATPAIELTRPQIQPSINYFDHRTVGKNVKRWVWFPGDTIIAGRKQDIDWLAYGGEETTSPCLQKYGRGFVPRGLSAMLELGGEPLPMKHLGEMQSVAWSGIALNEETIKSNFGFIPVYPGDGLATLRAYYMNDQGLRRGLDEDSALIGKEWEECHNASGTGILDVIERDMYGDGIEPTLRGLEDQIRHLKTQETRIDIGKLKEDRLRMCGEFRLWGETKLAQEHANLKLGTKAEWVYAYSPLGELLLVQLEVTRQDQPLAEMAKMHRDMMSREPAAPQGMSAQDMEILERRFEERIEERLQRAREADQRRIAELEAQVAQARQPEAAATTATDPASVPEPPRPAGAKKPAR